MVTWITFTSMEATIQLAIRYFLWHSKVLSGQTKLMFSDKPLKTKFIALWNSFLGFLSMLDFKSKAEDTK